MASQRNLKITVVVFLVTYTLLQLQLMQSKDRMSASSVQHLHNHAILTAAPSVTEGTKEQTRLLDHSTQQMDSTTAMNVPIQRTHCGGNVTLLLGHQRQNRGFLTIGLCTVPRSKASYLKDTLHSLVTRMSEADKKRVVIVVFMGYHNESIAEETLRMIKSNFNHSLVTGGLQVVQPDIGIYPNFSKITRKTFNDTLQRVHWRTKQNIDFAYLFGYCEGISDYYLHVEDDVVAATGYISDIETSLSTQERLQNQWFVLEFGGGFFGKLFRSRDLCMMKTYLLLFQVEKPGDLLLSDLKLIKLHDSKKVKNGKKLFKHSGTYSSLEGKIVKDKTAKKKLPRENPLPTTTEKIYISRLTSNPDAKIETSMKTFLNFTPESAYEINNTVYFWAAAPHASDYYRVILKTPVLSSRVTIRTGAPVTGKDRLDFAEIFINRNFTRGGMCRNQMPLGKLSYGKFEHKFLVPEKMKCLEILVTHGQKSWVIISQIEIET